jgi:hypothetical protein
MGAWSHATRLNISHISPFVLGSIRCIFSNFTAYKNEPEMSMTWLHQEHCSDSRKPIGEY